MAKAPHSPRRFLLLLLYILSLHAIAIFFFTRGFLLTRNELPLYSRCGDIYATEATVDHSSDRCDRASGEDSSCNCSRDSSDSETGNCWTRPLVNKVVILVLDALRFDFAAPSRLFTYKPKPWMDKLQVLQRLAFEERSAVLFKFIADPPTTSLQRLKGLTTGSLPTFIDVGNSFGAAAIVEDNIINQLSSNGKRIIMMGDDTWLQLFPTEFTKTYPFPSFNVKDLDTVDNGVVEHLFPALYEDSWDVLIGHFLGVDHAGHIFGVESPHMVDKLEQYNKVLEDVISVLQNQSFPGGLHEDTLLLVMGDHGQTLNGDHGGGTAEEVETALFAWSTRFPVHSSLQICPCTVDLVSKGKENNSCICDFQQLDFAATLAAIVGVPLPYGSIGRINPQLLSLLGGSSPTRTVQSSMKEEDGWLKLKWLEGYHQLLRLNGWQVNRYFEQYAESVMNGFSTSDLRKLQMLYAQAQSALPHFSNIQESGKDLNEAMVMVSDAVGKYTKYLDASASLARSKWTQFSDDMMGLGLVILFIAVIIQINAVHKTGGVDSIVNFEDCNKIFPLHEMLKGSIVFGISFGIFAVLSSIVISSLSQASTSLSWSQTIMAIIGGAIFGSAKSLVFFGKIIAQENDCKKITGMRTFINQVISDPQGAVVILFCVMYACSLLSNSYILKEQQVVTFFLVSSGFHSLRNALQKKSKVQQVMCFLAMNFLMGRVGSNTVFKDVEFQTNETVLYLTTPAVIEQSVVICFTLYLPLLVLGFYTVKKLWGSCFLQSSSSWVVFFGVPLSYIALMLHWLVGDLVKLHLLFIPETAKELVRLRLPQIVYYIVALQTLLLIYEIKDIEHKNTKVRLKNLLEDAAMLCLAVWGSLILLLLGRQGPLITLIAVIEGWSLMNMQFSCSSPLKVPAVDRVYSVQDYSLANFQWSLFAVQIFFSTGHRCAFDGLRYAAAFVGFDQFNIYRQGILLGIDTFGASHILPVVGLAVLVAKRNSGTGMFSSNAFYRSQFFQALLMYGLVRTVTTFFTTVCVTIQRRHLMVWGLFAPKFVFDAAGLLVTDSILFLFYAFCLPLLK